jgi:4-amino-4-deoxy-L-arabinose transferase-like glycosyltransferase
MNRWSKNRWIGLGILTVVLHAALVFFIIPAFSSRLAPSYNQDRFTDGYDALAANLVAGNGYRFYPETSLTLMREPGYPIVLAGLLLAFGSTFLAVKLTNVVLALATAWLIMRLARRISSNRILQIAPPILFLFHPATLIAESRGGVEILFTFLVMAFMLAAYKAIETNNWSRYALAGAVLGLTVLVRSTPMLFPAFLFAYLLVIQNHRVPRLTIARNIAIMIVAMVAMLSPWIIRNYNLTGRFVPTADVLGVSAHAGQYICTHFAGDEPWVLLDRDASRERSKLALEQGYQFKDGYYQAFYSTEDELKFSGFLAHRVFGTYKENPALCAKCMAYNLFNFWFAGKSRISTTMNVVVQLPYLILAAIGIVACVKNKKFLTIGPFVLFIVYVVAVYVPILAQARYSVPLIPFLSLLSAIALVAAQEKMSGASNSSTINSARLSAEPSDFVALVGEGREKR